MTATSSKTFTSSYGVYHHNLSGRHFLFAASKNDHYPIGSDTTIDDMASLSGDDKITMVEFNGVQKTVIYGRYGRSSLCYHQQTDHTLAIHYKPKGNRSSYVERFFKYKGLIVLKGWVEIDTTASKDALSSKHIDHVVYEQKEIKPVD